MFLSWTQLPVSWHSFIKMRKQNKGIIFNTIIWLNSNTSIHMYMYTERERENTDV